MVEPQPSKLSLSRHRFATVWLGLLGWSLCSPLISCACDESVTIDSVEYHVGERWCGLGIDSSEWADPATLVPLPNICTFEDSRIYLLPQARDAFARMAEAARTDSVDLIVDSGFRSLWFQRKIIRRRLQQGNVWETIAESVAPPGYSEHHTARAVDLVPSEARFAKTKAYAWLSAHASTYGFVESIPEENGRESFWEAWHWVYQGD